MEETEERKKQMEDMRNRYKAEAKKPSTVTRIEAMKRNIKENNEEER